MDKRKSYTKYYIAVLIIALLLGSLFMASAFDYFFSGDLEAPNLQGDNVLLALKNQAGKYYRQYYRWW